MTLECSLERFWGAAFLVTEVQPAMAMKSALTCAVADYVLEWFAKVKAEININWYLSFVIWKVSGDDKMKMNGRGMVPDLFFCFTLVHICL